MQRSGSLDVFMGLFGRLLGDASRGILRACWRPLRASWWRLEGLWGLLEATSGGNARHDNSHSLVLASLRALLGPSWAVMGFTPSPALRQALDPSPGRRS